MICPSSFALDEQIVIRLVRLDDLFVFSCENGHLGKPKSRALQLVFKGLLLNSEFNIWLLR